jgi:2-desacetyl-2-hydroxyethyl bacteriochlorophyllide A dehydrogenase
MKRRFFHFDHGTYGMGEEDVPAVAPDQVLIRTTRSLVSVGTETSSNTGKPRWKVGRHGYSHVGRVIEVGREVKDLAVGDRVATSANHTEYVVMHPRNGGIGCVRIPDDVTDEEATFLALGTVALYVVERAEITLGRPVVVVGQGTVGQMAQQLARLNGAGLVIAVEMDPARRALALQLGASAAIPPAREELDRALRDALPGSAAPAFLDVSGAAAAVSWCCEVAPLRSRVVVAGNYTQEASIRPLDLVEREIEIVGAHQPKCPNEPLPFYPYNRRLNSHFILESIRRKTLRVRELCDGLITPDQLLPFYDAARDNRPRLRQPIINWE